MERTNLINLFDTMTKASEESSIASFSNIIISILLTIIIIYFLLIFTSFIYNKAKYSSMKPFIEEASRLVDAKTIYPKNYHSDIEAIQSFLEQNIYCKTSPSLTMEKINQLKKLISQVKNYQ